MQILDGLVSSRCDIKCSFLDRSREEPLEESRDVYRNISELGVSLGNDRKEWSRILDRINIEGNRSVGGESSDKGGHVRWMWRRVWVDGISVSEIFSTLFCRFLALVRTVRPTWSMRTVRTTKVRDGRDIGDNASGLSSEDQAPGDIIASVDSSGSVNPSRLRYNVLEVHISFSLDEKAGEVVSLGESGQ